MSGFSLRSIDNSSNKGGWVGQIQRNIRYLSQLGMRWEDEIVKQSKSIGIAEAQMDSMYGLYYQQGPGDIGQDYGQKQFIAFYDKEYPTRRDFLRKFAMNGEIEYVLEVIADETIIYDENNYFAYPNTKHLKSVLKEEKAKEIVDTLNESYKKVYYAFGFNQGHDAWHYLKKFLIDGFLSFEIIYDEDEDEEAKNIIGFKELDPISLEPEIRKDDDGKEYRVWVQYRGDADKQRELLDGNLIYISWARGNFISRLSYVERLVRSFNMLRTLENSRIIWNVWNSQMRIKVLVPIGTQSESKARTRLSELRGMYKEEINIDDQSGEVTYNGSPQFNFAKTFVVPTRDGTQTEIDGFQPQGYDLSDTDALKYFWMRYIIETKVPKSRFSMDLGGAEKPSWSSGDTIEREELSFANFINRIRSIFQELIIKPTWLQFALKYPELAKDNNLKAAIGLTFIEENLFKSAKEREIAEKGSNTVTSLSNISQQTVGPDGEVSEEPYFDSKFLVEKYMNLTEDDIKLNEKYKKERREEIKKLAAAYARMAGAKQETSGEDMAAGGDFGGYGEVPGEDLGMGAEDMGDMGAEDMGDIGGEEEGGEELDLGEE